MDIKGNAGEGNAKQNQSKPLNIGSWQVVGKGKGERLQRFGDSIAEAFDKAFGYERSGFWSGDGRIAPRWPVEFWRSQSRQRFHHHEYSNERFWLTRPPRLDA